MGRRRIKLTVHGEGVPILRLAINVNPERYVTVRELLEVLSTEIHRHMGKMVTIPTGTKLFWKSSRGYTTPATSYMLVQEGNSNRDIGETVPSDLPIGLGLRHVGINVASRARRAQELSGAFPVGGTDLDKKGSDYFSDFILLKDASLVGDGDELLVDEWSDILKQTLDKQAEDARFSRIRGMAREDRASETSADALVRTPSRTYPFNLNSLLDRDDAGVMQGDDENPSSDQHGSHLVLLQKVLRELMMYHIKTTVFLSAQCSKEASIAAQDLSMAQFQNERVAEALLDEVTLEGTITDPSAVLRALTQLAVQRGKEEREHSDGLEAEKMRQLASVYRARIARLEAALNVSDEQVDQLQKKEVAIDIGFKEELQRANATISRLENENNALRVRIVSLGKSTDVLQDGLKSVAAVNERLFRETKASMDLPLAKISTDAVPAQIESSLAASERPRSPRRVGLLTVPPQKTSIVKLTTLSVQQAPTQERGVLGTLQEVSKSSNNAAQAVAQRMEEDHFTTVLSSTRDVSTLSTKVTKATESQHDSVRKGMAVQDRDNMAKHSEADPSWHRWKAVDESHRSATNVHNTNRSHLLLPSSVANHNIPQVASQDEWCVTIQLHIITELGEKKIDTIELQRGDAGEVLLPVDNKALMLRCTDQNAIAVLDHSAVPVNGHMIKQAQNGEQSRASKRRDRKDATRGVADPTSNFMAFYQQVMSRVRRWQSQARHGPVSDISQQSIKSPADAVESNVAKVAPAITSALFAKEDEESLATFPHSQHTLPHRRLDDPLDDFAPVDEDHCGYLLFFRLYYIRNGRRITIGSDEDLAAFLDARQGAHFTCNVMEVADARQMFANALIRRGIPREYLEEIEGKRVITNDSKSQSANSRSAHVDLDRLLQLGGHAHLTMGPAFSLVDEPGGPRSVTPASVSTVAAKKSQFFNSKRGGASPTPGADTTAGLQTGSAQETNPEETGTSEAPGAVSLAETGAATRHSNIFLSSSLEDVLSEQSMKKLFDSLAQEYAQGPVPGLPQTQEDKFASQKQPPKLDGDDSNDRPVKRVTVAHVVRYLSARHDDMGDQRRFWRVVEQVVQTHGVLDGDAVEPVADQSGGGDVSGALGSKNIDEAITAAILQAKGTNKRSNPRGQDSVAKSASDDAQVSTAQGRSHHLKQPVMFSTPVSFSNFALICLRLAKE